MLWSELVQPDVANRRNQMLLDIELMTETIRANRSELVADDDSLDFYERNLGDARPNAWADRFIYGSDPKFVMAITAKVNMVLHGDGSAHIFKWDSLRPLTSNPDATFRPRPESQRSVSETMYPRDVCETFDVVVSNPPFGITLDRDTRRALPKTFTLKASAPSEAMFLERWMQLLKPNGRLGVVVPESLLNTADALPSRLLLYRFFRIRAIVALPRNLFIDTPTLTSLLFAQKKTRAEIVAWDGSWSKRTLEMKAKVTAARRILSQAPAKDGSVRALKQALVGALSPLLGDDSTITRRGRPPLRVTAPLTSGLSLDDAARYFGRILTRSGFKALVRNEIFRLVATDHDYQYPVYAAEEVGYKLSKRGERARPNQLCKFIRLSDGAEAVNLHLADDAIDIQIDTEAPKRILDYLRRDVAWL